MKRSWCLHDDIVARRRQDRNDEAEEVFVRDDEAVEVSLTEAGTTLTIRLDPADGPISGVLVVGGDRRDFSGWIQLAALIDSLRPPADAGPAARPQELSSRSADAPGSPEAPRAS